MRLLKPMGLKKGDVVRIVASSSPFVKSEFLKGVSLLKEWGLKPKFGSTIYNKQTYLAGTDQRRATELIAALNDPIAKAIFFARGGYGAIRLLPYLQKIRLKTSPKIVMGYSDITVLLIYLYQTYGWTTFYGPVVAKDLQIGAPQLTLNSLKDVLMGSKGHLDYKDKTIKVLKKGKVNGVLVGGCLSLVASLVGTPFDLNTDNKILFLEDTNEKPYEIDRLLMQLKLAGKFKKCRGLVFGSLKGPNPVEHYQETIKSVLHDTKFPILFNFPAGHVQPMLTLPLGVHVCLDTAGPRITTLEAALK